MHGLQKPLQSSPSLPPDAGGVPVIMDPALLKSARQIYRTFYEVHPGEIQRPIGVAISRKNHRGKLIFGDRPVLLPSECFIPLTHIEPGLH